MYDLFCSPRSYLNPRALIFAVTDFVATGSRDAFPCSCSINPYWSAQEWQKMLYDHLAMTKDEAVDILTQKYADSINMFENIERQALDMADMMTQGIVKQFPQYFR